MVNDDARSHIVQENDLGWTEESHGADVTIRRKKLGLAAGGERIGCGLYELPPGKKSWPYHYHTANEEAIYVLSGTGTLRTAGGEATISAGDYIALPVGEEYARRVVNTSDEPLCYLCLSTMSEPEISVFPDSRKVGLFAGAAPGSPEDEHTLIEYLSEDAEVEYWEDELEDS